MIEDPVQQLGNRLLTYEPTDAELGERYRQEISAMLHRGPGIGRRWIQIGCSIVILLMGATMPLVPLFAPDKSMPLALRLGTLLGGAYMCIIGTLTLVCAIRRIDPRRYRAFWFGMGILIMVVLAVGLLYASWQVDDARSRWQLTEVAFVLLGLVAVTTVLHFVEDHSKRTELKLLELEYRLADLATRLPRQ